MLSSLHLVHSGIPRQYLLFGQILSIGTSWNQTNRVGIKEIFWTRLARATGAGWCPENAWRDFRQTPRRRVAEPLLPSDRGALTIRMGPRNCAPTATRRVRRLHPFPNGLPIALMTYRRDWTRGFWEIKSRPKLDRRYRFSACGYRLQLRPSQTPVIQISVVHQIIARQSACPYADSINRPSHAHAAWYAVAQRERPSDSLRVSRRHR